MSKSKLFQHWPTMLLGAVVAAIMLVAVFSYSLDQSENAVVTTFGRPSLVSEPGLHFRWPYPFQKIHRFDRRIRCFEGGAGKLEETSTSDRHNILVGIFVAYRIDDAQRFFTTFNTVRNAEEQLNSWMRGTKNAVFGQYRFNQIVNPDEKELKLTEIQDKIRDDLARQGDPYGIRIETVGISALQVPRAISEKVFARMIAERKRIADKNIAEGESEARRIRIKADGDRTIALADAEAAAKEIRARGDAEAAVHYAKFKEDPELALFLRQLESLRRILKGRTTLILDTDTVPFTLLKSETEQRIAPKK
ncbi:MAG: protease modulator HflC [Victivallaceae bacterium]|nr:protease modulator HflC [Victivallaceae bacterium]